MPPDIVTCLLLYVYSLLDVTQNYVTKNLSRHIYQGFNNCSTCIIQYIFKKNKNKSHKITEHYVMIISVELHR